MNYFRKYIPTFVELDKEPEAIPFETTDELLKIDAIKRCASGPHFSHFAMSGNALMEITDDGFCWWVLGCIDFPEQVDLPKWTGGKYRAENEKGEIVELISGEVVSSCGDVLTLQDGSKLKWLSK